MLGAEIVLPPHANRTMPAGDGTLSFDGRARQAPEAKLLQGQRELFELPRLHDLLARDNGVYAVFSDQVGFDGHSTHVGGAYVLAPALRKRRPEDLRRALAPDLATCLTVHIPDRQAD